MPTPEPLTPSSFAAPPEPLVVEAHTRKGTAVVALRGELDLATVSQVADAIDRLGPSRGGVRHLVLDLRGLTFMDVPGIHELIRQSDLARVNHHTFAVVRGRETIQRVLEMTGTDDLLALVDDPDDLAPRALGHGTGDGSVKSSR